MPVVAATLNRLSLSPTTYVPGFAFGSGLRSLPGDDDGLGVAATTIEDALGARAACASWRFTRMTPPNSTTADTATTTIAAASGERRFEGCLSVSTTGNPQCQQRALRTGMRCPQRRQEIASIIGQQSIHWCDESG